MHEYSTFPSWVFLSYSLIQICRKCFFGLSYFCHICWHWFLSNGTSWAKCVVKLWPPKPDPLDCLQLTMRSARPALSRCPPSTCPASPRFAHENDPQAEEMFCPQMQKAGVPGYLHALWVSPQLTGTSVWEPGPFDSYRNNTLPGIPL